MWLLLVRRVIIRTILITCVLFGVVSVSDAADAAAQTCLESLYLSYTEAQRDWQLSLKDLIVLSRPDFGELGSLSTELQLAMIEQAQARFRYLVTRDAKRVRADGDLSQFVNFEVEWTVADETALLAADPEYGALRAKIDSLRALNDGHPDWPALRAYWATELSQRAEYTEALKRFERRQTELEEELGNCASG